MGNRSVVRDYNKKEERDKGIMEREKSKETEKKEGKDISRLD